jgi:hypothetical protein
LEDLLHGPVHLGVLSPGYQDERITLEFFAGVGHGRFFRDLIGNDSPFAEKRYLKGPERIFSADC